MKRSYIPRVLGGLLAALVVLCWVYVNEYYHATAEAMAATEGTELVMTEELEDGTLIFRPEEVKAGLIFYPGGKVEHLAYAPLMEACAREGVLCVLVEMPFRLAVLDMGAAEGISEQFPEVEDWYIGGHSLGGSMAASYLADHTEEYEGLILLASYSTADLSGADLDVLSVYGDQDKVLDLEKYGEYFSNLPQGTREEILAGGCHAGFGSYGPQEGDGTPTMSGQEQIDRTAALILEEMGEN